MTSTDHSAAAVNSVRKRQPPIEAQHSDAGNRSARFHSATRSANESRSALCVAVAWRYVTEAQARPLPWLLDRAVALLWKLTH